MRQELRDEDRRREDRLECLGTRQPKCHFCPESNPFALHGVHPDIVCYECSAGLAGRSRTEGHHVGARRNDPDTVPVLGNDHRVLSDMQNYWPKRTLRNPDGSPLLTAAGKLRGWLNILQLIIERTVGYIPALLEFLDERLRDEFGDRWWERWDFEGVAP